MELKGLGVLARNLRCGFEVAVELLNAVETWRDMSC